MTKDYSLLLYSFDPGNFAYQTKPPIFELKLMTIDDVFEAIMKLSSSKSCSLDGITAFMIKSCKLGISPVLLHMYNLSIVTKCFPASWKFSKVHPLFKGGSATDCNNYRPISIIPTLGKILERIIHTQCTEYLELNCILSAAQSGFRKGRSTGTCVVEFLDNIYREIDRGRAVECSSWTWPRLLTRSLIIYYY